MSLARIRGAPWGALTNPLLRGGGSCGLGGPRLTLLQGTALVVHTAALELAQEIKEALFVGGWGPRDALGWGGCACSQHWLWPNHGGLAPVTSSSGPQTALRLLLRPG